MFAKPDIDLEKIRGDRKPHNIKLYKSLSALSGIVIVILIIVITVLINSNTKVQSLGEKSSLSNSSISVSEDSKDIINNLSKIYLLPKEDPTILEISDVNLVKQSNPDFYSQAEKNDKVILFQESKLAILYRVQENKIINVSKINFDSTK